MKRQGLILLYTTFIYLCCISLICDLSLAQNIDGTLKWTFRTNGQICSSPAIGRNGTTIYVGSNDKNLYAINLDGTLKWSYTTDYSLTGCSPVIGNDNTIYIGSYAINPDGTLKWKGKANKIALSIDGTIYYSYSSASAINPENGKYLWHSVDYLWSGSPPIVGESGTIYYLTSSLYSLTPNGEYILGGYDVPTPTDFQGSLPPIIDFKGTVFVAALLGGGLYALNQEDGTLKWEYKIGTRFGFIAIDKNGTIYSCSNKNYLHAINPDGSEKWTYSLNYSNNSSPAIGRDGTIFLNSSNDSTGNIHAINLDGSKKWILDIGNSTDHISSPVIGSNGIIYVGGSNNLYAINTNCGGLADSCWPMIYHDMYHSSNLETTIPIHYYTKEEVDQLINQSIKRTLQKWDIGGDNKKGLAEAIDSLKSIIKFK